MPEALVPETLASEPREVWWTAADGLTLFARDWGLPDSPLTPLLCLAGLTRNSQDFEALARRFGLARRIVCPDYRGRGRSHYAADWTTYQPQVELTDALGLLDHLGLARVGVVGTSRGGIIAMLMAQAAGQRLAGVFFNDIGPALAKPGLLRIRRMLSTPAEVTDWPGAVAALKANTPGFASLSEAQWLAHARRVFRDEDSRPVFDHDHRLMNAFPSLEEIEGGKVADLWPLFGALSTKPVTALRAEHSDLLEVQTLAAMAAAHPGLDAVTVKDRGHVPFLDEPESIAAIDRWLARLDEA